MNSILNVKILTERLASSGQPLEPQFKLIAQAGFQVVINLAMPNSSNAVEDESYRVTSLGMDYYHIPVPFDAPTPAHLKRFESLMQILEDYKVWVHCALNYRASAFLYHYYRHVLGKSEQEAQQVMLASWQPDAIWQAVMQWDLKA